jgi:DNA-binding NarL/FixJ family response regulator
MNREPTCAYPRFLVFDSNVQPGAPRYGERVAVMAPDTLRDELVRVAQVGTDPGEMARDAMRVLRRAVPFDGVALAWFDAATALPVGNWTDNSPTDGRGPRLPEIELREGEFHTFRQLAASGRRAARLSEATDARSRRERDALRPHGFGDELRAVCVGDSGLWGAIVMHRERGAADFTSRDVDLLASLVMGGRRAAFEEVHRVRLERDLMAGADDGDRGLLLLDESDDVEMADAAAAAWLDELAGDGRGLPLVVRSVAERARAVAAGRSGMEAMARARTAACRWVLVRGSVLRNGTRARTAVTLEPARAPDLTEVIADAHGLTARERRVTELVAQGLPTAAIAGQLYLSTYTVQDHLKAIFEKLEVSSRGELVARLFVDQRLVDP